MAQPLFVTQESLEAHLDDAVSTISKQLITPVTLSVDWNTDPVAAGIDGTDCETIDRTRGRAARAARFVDLKHGLWAWAGYREEWDAAPPAGRIARFSFRSSNITVFIGYRERLPKPQLLRLEWAGYSKQGGSFAFHGGNAGHPHWQFDLVESLSADTQHQNRELASVLRQEAQAQTAQPFVPSQVSEQELRNVVSVRKFSRLHLANSANWWTNSPAQQHSPVSVQQLRKWLDNSLNYIREELARV